MRRFFICVLFIIFQMFIWAQDNSRYVNPFIGTDQMGHTFPGPSLPWGFVQLSPDTDTVPYSTGNGYNPKVYEYCAGYQYKDPTIVGFSHTHLHGTGHSDLGDFLLIPGTGPVRLNPGTSDHPEKGYRSRYDKSTEQAEAGYYSVVLKDYGVKAELTATRRTGVHRYTWSGADDKWVLLDMVHGIYNYDGKVIWSSLRVINDTLVTGYRQTNGWARQRFIYFAMSFSHPVKSYALVNLDKEIYGGFWRRWKMDENFPERSGRKLKAVFRFDLQDGEALTVKVALSGVSCEGALKNLQTEAAPFEFDELKQIARQAWNDELDRFSVQASENDKVIFYTALYHSMLTPNIYQDIDAQYRGLDGEIHRAVGFTNYTVFSLWDTFRGLHPLMVLLKPSLSADFINSMLAHADQSIHGILPIWSHHANDNWCMTGYHSLPVIADAWVKGIRGFDPDKALQSMVRSATYKPYEGLHEYMRLGYIPAQASGVSVSTTLEYAYDDYTLMRMAESLGKDSLAKVFKARSLNWRNLFDYESGFMRPKLANGHFVKNFDPLDTHGQGFIEGNAWTYSLFVPHDPSGLIQIMGGEQKFVQRLDSLFTMELPEKYYANTEDIDKVGIMGNYVHGNEPGHHIPYFYNFTHQPWKTGERVEQILSTFYKNSPTGLCGNDDCGQMSAWYIFSVMGFYPFCPGSDEYAVGKPYFDKISVKLENGGMLNISVKNKSKENRYVREIWLNGKRLEKPFLHHKDIVHGADIIFVMGKRPHT
ncbi:MAG: glycoside hydrolase family 92 protein [Bacteroidales bacterium]|jgi:predicted alpha-1,2-mannosidase|nr:glycoside hydrolase family 92 protein [Bacteroidales bacterium]NPV35565.1 glycoside hydrolase family 92 protein [Bacteroidales bacterium]